MNVLITGSNGFVAKHLITYLTNHADINVLTWCRAFGTLSEQNFKNQYGDISIDCIIHLASKNFVPESWENPQAYLIENPNLTLDALKTAQHFNSKFIYLSSYLYGSNPSLPIDESHPTFAVNPYALGKLYSEQMCQFYAQNFGLKTIIFRPMNIYGPSQSLDFLIPKIIHQIKFNTNPIIQLHSITPKRDFVYIDDVCDAIVKALNFNSSFEIFNIGSGQSVSIEYIANYLISASGKQIELQSDNHIRKNEIVDVYANISKAKQLLNWVPNTELETGLKQCLFH